MNRRTALGLLVALSCPPALADGHLEPISDPAMLAELGFAPSAKNVWRLVDDNSQSKAFEHPQNSLGVLSSFSVLGTDFQMVNSANDYSTGGNGAFYCLPSSSSYIASASILVPDGVSLQYFDVFASDASATESVKAHLLATCHVTSSPAAPANFVLASYESSGSGGNQYQYLSISSPSAQVDMHKCSYTINLVLGAGACSEDLKLHKARVLW